MKKGLRTVVGYFVLGIALQAGIYYYLENDLFAPSADYDIVSNAGSSSSSGTQGNESAFADVQVKGRAYYSHDYQYMADVSADSVIIYHAGDLDNPQEVELKGQGVSFFEWLPDRDLGLIALYPKDWHGGRWNITLARYNPEATTHESDAPIKDLPKGSKIVDVAFSTATNEVYLKVEVGDGLYRIYRTDANYATRRIFTPATSIGKIAVFFDEGKFFYDDADKGIIYLFNSKNSSWRIISPPGRYRLVGIGPDKVIYAARVNNDGEAVGYYTGKLGVGFEQVKKLDTPVNFNTVTMHLIEEAAKKHAADKAAGKDDGTNQKEISSEQE